MEESKTLKRIFQDRKRTNVLKSAEQATISYLVKRVPAFVSSNNLTFLGTIGSVIVLAGFILAAYISRLFAFGYCRPRHQLAG
jgi:predicted phage tail protein